MFRYGAHMAAARFADLDEEIRTGAYRKITSIVVAQHGTLVHEHYL